MSKAVKALEDTLGTTLLERRKSGTKLTVSGQRVYERCIRIFDELSLLVSETKGREEGLQGDLWIAANEHVAAHLLPAAVIEIRKKHPGVVPRIVTGAAHLLVPEIVSGRIELGLFFKVEATARLDRRIVARSKCQVVIARDRRNDEATLTSFIGSREVDDLSNKSFPTVRMLQKKRPQTRITTSCSSLEAHRQMVMAGVGVSVLPLFVVEDDVARGRMTIVEPTYAYWAELFLVTRRGHEPSPAARELQGAIRRALASVTSLRP